MITQRRVADSSFDRPPGTSKAVQTPRCPGARLAILEFRTFSRKGEIMRILSASILCFAALFAGCGDNQSKNMDPRDGGAKPAGLASAQSAAASVVDEITGTLEGVTDGESAEAARSELEALVGKVEPLFAKVKAAAAEAAGSVAAAAGSQDAGGLGAMGAGLVTSAKSALGGPLKSAMESLDAEIKRIAGDSELLAPLKDVIEKLRAAIKI